MSGLPAGRVTFLFTDIEGSTRLLRAVGDRYAGVLTDHRRLLREAFAQHGGVEVDTQGDSFFVAFSDPYEAVAAAADGQRALATHPWPDGELRVRMGLHTGSPLLADGHYFGIDVHRGARIAAAAHGGQVVLSQQTSELAFHDGSAAELRDLGLFQLKDLPEPERLYQLVLEGLPSTFPPLRAQEDAIAAAGLPDYSLPPAEVPCPYKGLLPFEPEDSDIFFGREQLVEHLSSRLDRSNFLAVVGPSGSGKSSVVRAGLAPALGRGASIISPGADPLAKLAEQEGASLLVVDQFEEVFTLCRDEEERRDFIDGLLDAAEGGRVIVVLRADLYGHCAAYPRLASALEDGQALVGPMSEEELRRAIERPAEVAGLVLEPGLVEAMVRDVAGQPGALPLLSHSLLETWKRRSGRMLTVIGYLQSGGVQGAIAKTAETVFRDRLPSDQQLLARNIFLRLTALGDEGEATRRRATIAELVPRPELEGEVNTVLRMLADARLVTVGESRVDIAHEALIQHWPRLRSWLSEDREGRRLHRRLTESAQEWSTLEREKGSLFRGARLASTLDWAATHDEELNPLERDFLNASRREGERAVRRLRAGITALAVLLLVAVGAGIFAFHQRNVSRHQATLATGRGLTQASAASIAVDPERSILLALKAIDTFQSTSGAVPATAVEALHSAVEANRLRLTIHTPASSYVAFSPNRRLAATASAQTQNGYLWDARTGERLHTLAAPPGGIGPDLRFSPDGSVLYSHVGGLGLIGWSTHTGKQVFLLRTQAPLNNLALSPDGRRIAATAFDGTLTIWSLGTRRQLLQVAAPNPLCGTSFSPDGHQIAAALCFNGPEATALVWNSRTGRQVLKLGGPTPIGSATFDLAYSPDGRELVTVANDGKGKVWDARTGRLLTTLVGHTGWIFAVKFSPDGRRIATGAGDATARIWDARTGHQLLVLAGHSKTVYDLAFNSTGSELLTGSADGTARIWNLLPQGSRDALTIPAQSGFQGALAVAYSPSGRLLAVGGGGRPSASLWDAATGRRVRILRRGGDVYATVFSPDGRRIVVTGTAGASIMDTATARTLVRLSVPSDDLAGAAAWSPNGKIVALSLSAGKGAVLTFDSGTGKQLRTFPFPPDGVLALAIGPEGSRLAAAGGGTVGKLWDFRTGRVLGGLVGHKDALTSARFSPDGTRIATTSFDGTIRFWNANTGKLLSTVQGTSSGALLDGAFSPDGKEFASGDEDTTVKLWDTSSHQELLTLTGATRGVSAVAFSPDGTRVAAASADGAVRVYILPLGELMRVARGRLTRSWTQAECRQFLNTNSCPPTP